MRESDQILSLWAECQQSGESAVLITVLRTRGSSYRLPGARLIITAKGRRAGSVSGGCLEDDLIKKAWWLTENNRRVIRRYDTTSDTDGTPAYGLGCNGIIDVLLERVTPLNSNVLALLNSVRETRRAAAIVHVIQPHTLAGQRISIDSDGEVHREISDANLASQLEAIGKAALAERSSGHIGFTQDGQTVECFAEVLTPPVRLLVFGAGDDAIPVTELAYYLGWSVFVFDGRAHYARPERFPKAGAVIVSPIDQLENQVDPHVDPWTVAALMTHSYSQDLAALRALAEKPLRYLGILGPRKRTAQLLIDAGLDASRLAAALHSPMGLDIGADGPQQVALSVIAEIQASLNSRLGGQLKQRAGSIHSRDAEDSPQGFTVHSIVCA
ncbi:MAG TPA: XdhC family protein [Bryobacteraceae bacterium]|nr:XdhC family protein [Bryobacteraceae bacterium]